MVFGGRSTWVGLCGLSVPSSATLGRSLHFAFQFLHLQNEANLELTEDSCHVFWGDRGDVLLYTMSSDYKLLESKDSNLFIATSPSNA